jgi:hypothetical protein
LADEAYQLFVTRLTSRGFDVLNSMELAHNSMYLQLKDWACPVPSTRSYQDMEDRTGGEVAVFAPRALPLYFISTEPGGSAINAARKDSPDDTEPWIVQRLDSALIRVTLKVDFLQFASARKLFKDQESTPPYEPLFSVTGRVDMITPATITVEEKPFNRGLKVTANEKQPYFILQKPVTAAGYFVRKSNVQSMLASDGGVKDVDMEVHPQVYGQGLMNAVENAVDLLTYRMQECR